MILEIIKAVRIDQNEVAPFGTGLKDQFLGGKTEFGNQNDLSSRDSSPTWP